MASVDGYKSCDYDDHVSAVDMQKRLSTALTDVHRAWATERREWHSAVREWAAYCRAVQPGPNIADTMLKFIGDPPHDYASDAGAKP